ncbi:flagellar hook-length control protein FliK [Caldibacillus thermoamylovorans]|uniref:flagellar hook-length control protein FliK n=1 Tax=Caldibacillus thermoamylovorans TaxID=35841 RepID=UPI002041B6D5|nr:flagellar hook-length control protein FliK [Caldibacillus thermoamylovorans]MCM3797686.1 flagellar hook-length control protein FliK [Caldibacillus thermoamylovorans]
MISVSGNSQVLLTNPQQNHDSLVSQEGQVGSFEQLLALFANHLLEENANQGKNVNQGKMVSFEGLGHSEASKDDSLNLEKLLELTGIDADDLLTSIQNILGFLLKETKDNGTEDEQIQEQIRQLLEEVKKDPGNPQGFVNLLQLMNQFEFSQVISSEQSQDFTYVVKTAVVLYRLLNDNKKPGFLTQEQEKIIKTFYQNLQANMKKSDVLQSAFAKLDTDKGVEDLSVFRSKQPYLMIRTVDMKSSGEAPSSHMVNNNEVIDVSELPKIGSDETGQNQQLSGKPIEAGTVQTPNTGGSLQLLEGNKPVTMERFIKDFETILAKSKFYQNGQVQKLTIQLKPEHLGTLKIELIQQHNELVAKIISSTTSARELLESQSQALKQALVQQNIPINRIDFLDDIQQERFNHQQPNQNNDQRGYQQHEEKKDEQNNEDFMETFKATLLNYEI